jgi:hypothetical protein
MDETSIEMPSKDAQEKQEDLPDSRVPLTSAQGLPSPGSSTSETSDYQRSTPSPNNEADIQNGSLHCKNVVLQSVCRANKI